MSKNLMPSSSSMSSASQNDKTPDDSGKLREALAQDLENGEHLTSLPNPEKKEADIPNSIIDFDGQDDPYNAINWSIRKKIYTTLLYSFTTMTATWASTIYNSGLGQVEKEFHVTQTVAVSGTSLYLFGNAFGPMLFAPISELYGRKISVVGPVFLLMVFSFATATSKDIQTILITRFFAGVFASAPLSNVGGVLADVWKPEQRGVALLGYGAAIIIGPLVAPIVGGALVTNLHTTGWRWTEYLTGILTAVVLVLDIFFIDESFSPVLLSRKANKIRHETKNWTVHSKSQEIDYSFKALAGKYLVVPFQMIMDPICLVINLYAAFCYAIIYLTISAFPFEFEIKRGWNAVIGSLPFLALLVGAFLGAFILAGNQKFYVKRLIANKGKPVPEARLPPMMIGSVFFAGGLFIMGWTSNRGIHWIGFCIGAVCVGIGFFTIFQSALGYLVDTYLMLAASALAVNMLMRSALAGAFPLFANATYTNLGINWSLTLMGFIAVAMIPIPYLFYVFGKRLRGKGKRSRGSL